MKVAYVLAQFPSISETFILREILALQRLGLEIVIFSIQRPKKGRLHPAAERLARDVRYAPPLFSAVLARRSFHYLVNRPWRSLALLWRLTVSHISRPLMLLRVLRHYPVAAFFAHEAEVAGIQHVHAHFAYVPADVAQAIAGLIAKPFSFAAHAWDIYALKPRPSDRKFSRAAFIVACTQHGKERLLQLLPRLSPDKLVVIHHGIDVDRYHPASPVQPLILGVGRLEPKKGFASLVEACRTLRGRGVNFLCALVGDGSERERLMGRVFRYGLDDCIFRKGWLNEDDLIKLYRRASILVMPSVRTRDDDQDGLPNVVIEALAMEVPVVCTDQSASSEIVEDGVNGFIVSADSGPQGLADKLALLLADPALRQRMGRAGRTRVLKDFDIARNTDELRRQFAHSVSGAEAETT